MRELKPWLALIFRRPRRLAVGGVLLLMTLLSGIGLLAVSGWFITESALVGALLAAGVAATINLYVPGGAIRFFAVSRTVSRYLERLYNHDTVLRLLSDIRGALFGQLALSRRRHRGRLSGAQWLSRLTNDVDALDTLYLRWLAPAALAVVVSLLLAAVSALLFNGLTGLWVGCVLLLALLVGTVLTDRRTRRLSARRSDCQEDLRQRLIEYIEGQAELMAAKCDEHQAGRLLEQGRDIARDRARVDTVEGWHLALITGLIQLSAVGALWSGFSLFQAGQLSAPVLVLLPLALLGLAEAFSPLPEAFARLGGTRAAAHRLNRDTRGPAAPGQEDSACLPPDTALWAESLTIRHGVESPAIDGFHLRVGQGEWVGLVGPSGSGKSSLADAFAGLLPVAGRLARLDCACLTQSTVLFEDTLRANLLLGDPNAGESALWAVLALVELDDRFESEPEGLDTWLGSAGSRLSGGEARRVALARVLLHDAPLVILDEPFTGLDEALRQRIAQRLRRRLSGRAVLCLGHGEEALPPVDRIVDLGGTTG